MANLIKKIAIADSQHADDISVLYERATSFLSEERDTTSVSKRRHSLQRLSMFLPKVYHIRNTEENSMQSTLKLNLDLGAKTKIVGTVLPETQWRDPRAQDFQDTIGDSPKSSAELKSNQDCYGGAILARPEPVLKRQHDQHNGRTSFDT
jgi:hypothetical protein